MRKGQKRSKRYPWDDWFSKQVTLEKGKDFTCQLHGFVQAARQAAARKGIKVVIGVDEDKYVTISKVQ